MDMNCCHSSELQLGDELHIPGAAVAEIRIKRIRRAGQTEAGTESRRRVGKVRMVPDVEKFSAQAQPPVTRDLLRFDKRDITVIQSRSAESISPKIAVGPRQSLRERCRMPIWPRRLERHAGTTYQLRAAAKV